MSRKEQKKRFLDRLEQPEKNWKFSSADLREREHWDEYMKAYEEMIVKTLALQAPWFVIPADNKWFTRLAWPRPSSTRSTNSICPIPSWTRKGKGN